MSQPAPSLFQQLKNLFIKPEQFAQVVPQVIQQTAQSTQTPIDTLNPAYASGTTSKEAPSGITLERPAFDQAGGGIQHVEQEKNVEISPEVESFITKVAEHTDQLPQEIVIADQTSPVPTTKYLATPVIILPITPEIEKAGAKKAPQFSVRWLVEWSRKLMKAFAGRVIYREVS